MSHGNAQSDVSRAVGQARGFFERPESTLLRTMGSSTGFLSERQAQNTEYNVH